MKSVRGVLAAIVISFLLGGLLSWLIGRLQTQEAVNRSNDLVDFVIEQWTGFDASMWAEVATVDREKAQFAALKELPMSRLGYFPDTVRSLALMVETRYRVPAAVTLAQWALESGWGKRNLGVSNYFGHTFNATKRFLAVPKYVMRRELINVVSLNVPGKPMKFASYTSIKECFEVHGQYLSQSQLYRAAFFANNPEQFARIISLYYAADPDYATKLITIIRRYEL